MWFRDTVSEILTYEVNRMGHPGQCYWMCQIIRNVIIYGLGVDIWNDSDIASLLWKKKKWKKKKQSKNITTTQLTI